MLLLFLSLFLSLCIIFVVMAAVAAFFASRRSRSYFVIKILFYSVGFFAYDAHTMGSRRHRAWKIWRNRAQQMHDGQIPEQRTDSRKQALHRYIHTSACCRNYTNSSLLQKVLANRPGLLVQKIDRRKSKTTTKCARFFLSSLKIQIE